MTHRILIVLAVIGGAFQATIALGFFASLTVIGLTAYGIIPAPL